MLATMILVLLITIASFCVTEQINQTEDEEKVGRQSQALTAALEGKGYHISAGMAWAYAPVKDLEALVKAAEQRMYASKHAYYQNLEYDRRFR